jgi:hypothetical protein
VAERERREAAERAAADEHMRAARAGTPKAGRRPRAAAAELAALRVARETARQQAAIAEWERRRAAGLRAGRRRPVPPAQYCRVRAAQAQLEQAVAAQAEPAAAAPAGAAPAGAGAGGAVIRRNVTDPGSRLMPVRGGGFIQGYNAQNVTSEDGLVIATELTDDTGDTRWFGPMMAAAGGAAAAMAAAGGPGTGEIGLALADAGYLSEDNLTCPGPDRLIATGKRRDLEKRARAGGEADGGGSPLIAAMTARLATADGIAAYRRRGHIGETFHGNLKHNLGFRRLSVRGKRKASGEWTFACTVHNLLTAITSGRLTPQALAALAR